MEAHRGSVQPEDDDWVAELERRGWAGRPFARTFDLIAQEYGWTDGQILDLTLSRMKQIRSVIWERRAEERRLTLRDKEAELRTLASFMAQTRDAARAAQRIRLLKRPKGAPSMPDTDTVLQLFGGVEERPETVS